MKSAVFERQEDIGAALETVHTTLVKFPKFPKFYMIQGQIYQSQGNYPVACAVYAAGMKHGPQDVTLWTLVSRRS
jgi:pre-mRNA-processing factor 6